MNERGRHPIKKSESEKTAERAQSHAGTDGKSGRRDRRRGRDGQGDGPALALGYAGERNPCRSARFSNDLQSPLGKKLEVLLCDTISSRNRTHFTQAACQTVDGLVRVPKLNHGQISSSIGGGIHAGEGHLYPSLQ
jgi:hypothetical protein